MIGGNGDGHTGFTQRRNGWQLCFAQHVVRAWQQHRHRTAGLHGRHAISAEVFQMIATEGTVLRGHDRATTVTQLLGMQLDRQAKLSGHGKDARHLLWQERDTLAEGVHGIHQPRRVLRA